MKQNRDQLSALFQKLGARNPEGWAASQIEEGLPQLQRFLFLRQAWRHVVSETDPAWCEARIAQARQNPGAPYSGVGLALQRLRELGATPEDLTDLVRGMQAQLLFHLCNLLEDSGDLEPEVANTAWGLFVLDTHGQPAAPMMGLHESVLETDPTGREMRPRRPPG